MKYPISSARIPPVRFFDTSSRSFIQARPRTWWGNSLNSGLKPSTVAWDMSISTSASSSWFMPPPINSRRAFSASPADIKVLSSLKSGTFTTSPSRSPSAVRVGIGGGGTKELDLEGWIPKFDLEGGIPKEALGGWNTVGARGCKGARLGFLLCCLKTTGQSLATSKAEIKKLTHGAFKTTSTSSSSEDITILLSSVLVDL